MKVFITRRIPKKAEDMLIHAGHEVIVSTKKRPLLQTELIAELKKSPYDAIISLLTDKIDARVFDAAPRLKIVSNYAAGFNNIDLAEARKRGIFVTNTPDVSSEAVAVHTMALILALSRRVVEGDRFVRAKKYIGWDPLLFLGEDLKDRTIGVIGAGHIGKRVIEMAVRGFQMKAVYFDLERNRVLEEECGARFCEKVEHLLSTSDVISLHVPLNKHTHHLVATERLSLMKKGAYLINTSRGPVVSEKDLYTSLKLGHLGGAALDVFEDEPLIYTRLLTLSNVIFTPHIASSTVSVRDEMARLAAEAVIHVGVGQRPFHIVTESV